MTSSIRSHPALLLALLFALLMAAPAAAELPGLGDRVPRVTVDARVAPWSSLVRVQAPGLVRCTGVLVAPDLVATAAHCLYSVRLGHFIPPGSVNVLLGYAAGAHAGHAVADGYRTADGFDPQRVEVTRGADVALIHLAVALSGPVLRLAESEAAFAVVLGGYQQDRNEVIAADFNCRLTGVVADAEGRTLLTHGCAATRGSSGAPLLAQLADGTWRILGIQSGGRRDARGGVAVPVATLRSLLP